MIIMKFNGNLSDASRVIRTQRHMTTNKNYVMECTLCKDTFNCNEVNPPPSHPPPPSKHSIAVVLWQLRIMLGRSVLMAARNISRYGTDSEKT